MVSILFDCCLQLDFRWEDIVFIVVAFNCFFRSYYLYDLFYFGMRGLLKEEEVAVVVGLELSACGKMLIELI